MRVQTRILQAISQWKRPVEGKEFGSVECCDRSDISGSVELERGWTVGGLHKRFLSQISMLTDWDVLVLQECFRKLNGVNVGAHELFTPPELLGDCDAQQSSCIRDGVVNQKLFEERTDGLRSSWMDR